MSCYCCDVPGVTVSGLEKKPKFYFGPIRYFLRAPYLAHFLGGPVVWDCLYHSTSPVVWRVRPSLVVYNVTTNHYDSGSAHVTGHPMRCGWLCFISFLLCSPFSWLVHFCYIEIITSSKHFSCFCICRSLCIDLMFFSLCSCFVEACGVCESWRAIYTRIFLRRL